MSAFGKLLESNIQRAGFRSLRAFAESSGLSRESIRLYVAGSRLPTADSLDVIIRTLRVRGTKTAAAMAAALAEDQLAASVALRHLTALQAKAETASSVVRRRKELVDLFFEHSGRRRTAELETFITRRVEEILDAE